MTLGTFTFVIDGDRFDGEAETTARVSITSQNPGGWIKDSDGSIHFKPEKVTVALPYSITLPTDVTSGTSTNVGYIVSVATGPGASASAEFAAPAAGSTVYFGSVAQQVVAPLDDATAAANRAEAAAASIDPPTVVRKWKAFTAYAAGAPVIAPDGSLVTANAAFTSGATYSSKNWTSVGVAAGTQAATELSSAFTRRGRTRYVDAYQVLFGNNTRVHVNGQSGASTTATGAVAAGGTVIPFASMSGVVVGMWYVLKPGGTPQLVQVQSVSGSNVTVTPAINQAIASGEALYPLWTDRYHLTAGGGFKAFWNAVANAVDANGSPVFTDPGVGGRIVFLGNSWGVIGGPDYTAAFQAKFPNASVELAAVSGNTSQQLLDRFDTDVTGHPVYVLFNEPGVNDVLQGVPLLTQGSQIAALARKIEALGAIPVYVGPPPLRGWTTQTDATSAAVSALGRQELTAFARGAGINAETSDSPAYTVRLGKGTNGGDRSSLATRNVAIGHAAQAGLTDGSDDVAVGYAAQQSIGAGVQNTALGSSAQNLATGSFNTAVGHSAQKSQTTANLNTAVGYRSQYAPNGDVTAATTTGIHQTSIGAETGQSSGTAVNDITTVGYRARAGANNATAIGSGAVAGHLGSVALGQGASTTDINQVQIGARHFEFSDVASVPAAPGAGGVRLFGDLVGGKMGLYVRFPTGVTQQLAIEA